MIWSLLHRTPNYSDQSIICLEALKNMKYGYIRDRGGRNTLRTSKVILSSPKTMTAVSVQTAEKMRNEEITPEAVWARARFTLNIL